MSTPNYIKLLLYNYQSKSIAVNFNINPERIEKFVVEIPIPLRHLLCLESSFEIPNTDENEKILSPVMLMFWLAYLPRNHEEFLSKFRESDRLGIAENERIFIDDICQIIDEHF